MFWWEFRCSLVGWDVVLFSEFHVFVFQDTWQLCPEKSSAFLIQFAKIVNVMELMSQAMMSSRFLTMSVERLPEGLSCFVFTVDNCLCQWARGIWSNPIDIGVFSFPNWEMPPLISSWQKFKRSDLLWFGESLWTQAHSSLEGIKLIWQNPSKIHLHISFE